MRMVQIINKPIQTTESFWQRPKELMKKEETMTTKNYRLATATLVAQ